jgi:hypothetical protein
MPLVMLIPTILNRQIQLRPVSHKGYFVLTHLTATAYKATLPLFYFLPTS